LRTWIWFGIPAIFGLIAACGNASTNDLAGQGPDPSSTTDASTVILPDGAVVHTGSWDDPTAIQWLNKYCANCHGIDESGQQAPYYSAWPMAKPLTREWLETSDYTPAAYETILNRITNAPGPPSAMPIAAPASAQESQDLKAAIDWFTRRVPFSVIDANKRYGNKSDTLQQVTANFDCAKRVSLRAFLTSLTLGLFDRYPNANEFNYFQPAELNGPVTLQEREHIAAWLDTTWKPEFLAVGLRKFANVVGGAPQIAATTNVTAVQAADLQQEFYQQLLAGYDSVNYADFFKSNNVMVSANTAALYNCAPPASGWTSCAMQPPRKTFFTTRGYLVSKPSSFLVQNNNYGRVALIFFTLYGEKLFAATNGPTGDSIPPLPNCLEANDTRTFTGAPRGTAAVPMAGAVCQGCHVARGLAAGSVLFRPFARNGEVYNPATLSTDQNPDKKYWDMFFDQPDPDNPGKTIETLWGYLPAPTSPKPVKVDTIYMNSLLGASTAGPHSCIASGNKAQPYIAVSDIGQLVDEYLKNTTSFSRGFTRHAQRAFMNQTQVTLEMSIRASTAFDQGKQKIPDLLKAYFLSDTLTCEE
jgi:mono/diheme cytochrome c family protein